jgi:transposase
MVWSAAETLARGFTTGNQVVSFPAAPPVARLGERRAAPPGTRLSGRLCLCEEAKKGRWQDLIKEFFMELHAIGIDLGKTVFHLVGLDSSGNVVVRKRCSRTQLLKYTANLRVQRIGMEACSGSHFLARALREQGHDARLIPAQYVKPYVKTNKSDYIDAEAIAEAVQRPTMRFVPIKTEEQLDLQTVHRVRERWVMRRTAVVNQIRGLLLERGLTLPTGRSHVDRALPEILTDPALKLAGSFRVLLSQLQLELEQLSARIEQMDAVIQETARENEACPRLTAIPGIGPVTATALVAAIGNGAGFRRGKDLAAWVGMVPREYSTGGKQKLLGISKRGNSYLRRLFVQGARVVMQYRTRPAPGLSNWLSQLMARTHQNVAVVALANKLLRMAWAVLRKNETYRIPQLAIAP